MAVDALYVTARRVFLDALEALVDHRHGHVPGVRPGIRGASQIHERQQEEHSADDQYRPGGMGDELPQSPRVS